MRLRTRTENWSRGARCPGDRRAGDCGQDVEFGVRCGRGPDEQKESVMQTKLSTEVRQSLSLLAMTALTLLASIGLGILAGQLG
jgi:hypothetical protein